MTYDSTADTLQHIDEVKTRLFAVRLHLMRRGAHHDLSKLASPEKEAFDQVTPKLKTLEYGTEEYRASLRELKPALEHHYKNNSHHPEHYGDLGILGFDLFDLIEMYCDWQAAVLRGKNGDFAKSLEINRTRFKIDEQLMIILHNTFIRYGDLGAVEARPKFEEVVGATLETEIPANV